MKIKTISKAILSKFDDWVESIDNPDVAALVEKNTIFTGGCIASMLLKEPVNDFDIYFRNKETVVAVAEYYLAKFGHPEIKLKADEDRVRITTESGRRGETVIDRKVIDDPGRIEDVYQETEEKALTSEDEAGKPKYRPVFVTTNAITLTNKVQIVLRFYGDPDIIHENYDFVHCTNYWTSWDEKLVIRQAALESLITKELRYVGSRYPVCSVIRLRKFIARGWTVNAGQILKMLMQINELDLCDLAVLEDQLTGVDSAFFCDVIRKLNDKDPEKVNASYLVEIIDRIF